MTQGLVVLNVWIISDRLVNQTIWMTLESLKDLLADLLLPIDQVVTNSVVIEPHLAVVVINLNKFSQITFLEVLLVRCAVVLDGLKLVGESPSHHELVLSMLEV